MEYVFLKGSFTYALKIATSAKNEHASFSLTLTSLDFFDIKYIK